MREREQPTRAERLGEYAGRCWRSYLRGLDRLSGGLQRVGVPYVLSRMITWGLQALVLFVLLCVAFWVTVIVAFIFVAVLTLVRSGWEREEWGLGEQNDHKKSVFYDPINYNDPDDPRFED
ncbi:DUF3742 family protein [Pseudomonas bijieensis]|uniref:DUF3742 family protein n=1 Tax=Pseudomonas bijieensis TaxID=2681983 RepID=UPI003D167C7C